MTKLIDITGQTFGLLTVVSRTDRPGRYGGVAGVRWLCQCACGNAISVGGAALKRQTVSCGCVSKNGQDGEGARRYPEYHIWRAMQSRCLNPSANGYIYYGGRGIRVCDEWMKSFWTFYRDVGPRPSPSHSIDRIDNNGNYAPGNCRWATKLEQTRNRRPRHEWPSVQAAQTA